ncbi:uncharacterized protein VNE69_04029 [Vairimorpha necatrix]|uniref:Membrane protein n=1 Tax=Vairimorpha necatrix TaxID=6039 RepID=A0AAX4JB79_9MICR
MYVEDEDIKNKNIILSLDYEDNFYFLKSLDCEDLDENESINEKKKTNEKNKMNISKNGTNKTKNNTQKSLKNKNLNKTYKIQGPNEMAYLNSTKIINKKNFKNKKTIENKDLSNKRVKRRLQFVKDEGNDKSNEDNKTNDKSNEDNKTNNKSDEYNTNKGNGESNGGSTNKRNDKSDEDNTQKGNDKNEDPANRGDKNSSNNGHRNFILIQFFFFCIQALFIYLIVKVVRRKNKI